MSQSQSKTEQMSDARALVERLTGYTPGPWRILVDDTGDSLSGRPSVSAAEKLDCGIVHADGFVQHFWRSARGDKEIHANAHLIAAAPELHDALSAALDEITDLHAENERLRSLMSNRRAYQVGKAVGASSRQAEIERMREALSFYADVSKYPSPLTGGQGDLYYDCGQIARAALERKEGET